MCTREGGEPCCMGGRLRSVWRWFRDRTAGPARPPGPDPTAGLPDDIEDIERITAATQAMAKARNLAAGCRMCLKCDSIIGREDGVLLHEQWCYACDATWLEDRILGPLVDRLGRHGARKALRKLVRRAKALV